ncbi:MAG TPA: formate dehydrogenase subunit gamma [Methylomirabilota bacterium]|nr:formate dehydrogenase subunit gamma [Methylomirabilota bacterium]
MMFTSLVGRSRWSIVAGAALVLLVAGTAAAQHPPIYLLDANGDTIDPITDENASAPFSIKQTCGMCHDYDVITQGYHFQMGWDVVSDDYGVEAGRPWSLSNGLMGRWYPFAFRQLAKKSNEHPDEIDLTVYDFVGFSSPGRGEPPCGACHPGGGGLEFDRDGERYDERLAGEPELAETLDGDYHRSKWDRSGVVEADCLICHLEGYDFESRVDQLKNGNYKWAVVAGSRIGIVEGAVRRDQEPEVLYEKRLFNADGTITLEMSWPPPDENCEYCHGRSDVKKRGFSWNDIFNPDIHNQQGISCTACHPAGLDHQIAKGTEPAFTLAPELDGSNKSCEECHMQGYLGAPVPEHVSIRPSHLARITCESCHIPQLNRAAANGLEVVRGSLEFYPRPPEAEEAGEVGLWNPDYVRREDGNVYPINRFLAVYWANRDADGLVHPLFLREHEAGWKGFAEAVTDDNEDGRLEVNRPEEIVAGLKAFAASLQGNRRFERIQPVFIKSETAYELDENGELVTSPLAGTPLEGGSEVEFSINHNTAPTRMTLGVNGCEDCHVAEAHMFRGQQMVDLHGPDGSPVTISNGRFFGCNLFAFRVNSIHQQIVSPYIGPMIMLVVFLIVVHYHSYGPKRITFDPYSEEVERFTLFERGVHLFRLISFVFLAVTGLILAFNLHLWQQLLFGSAATLHNFHVWMGIVFIATTVLGAVLWFRDATFESYDKDWVRKMGGYLGHKGEVPAGRFNAGQKMFYWLSSILGVLMGVTGLVLVFKGAFSLPTICVTSTIHNLLGFFLIAGVVAHAYLGTVANPGTWRVLVDGSVTREWAKHHHPNWFRKLVEQERIEEAEAKLEERSGTKPGDGGREA